MFDFHAIAEFTRIHCIALCAFLVPANLGITLLTIVLTVLGRPQVEIWRSAAISTIPAGIMIFHVFSWFAIGVVMSPTYILLCMAIVCLSINIWAIASPLSMMRLFKFAVNRTTSFV